MNYNIKLNDRPFKAIQLGTKKIEGRIQTKWDKNPYDKFRKGDIIIFTNRTTAEILNVEVMAIRYYVDIRSMLENEGMGNVLSSGLNIEDGIKNYNALDEYKKNVSKFGIYAIEMSLL